MRSGRRTVRRGTARAGASVTLRSLSGHASIAVRSIGPTLRRRTASAGVPEEQVAVEAVADVVVAESAAVVDVAETVAEAAEGAVVLVVTHLRTLTMSGHLVASRRTKKPIIKLVC